MGALFISGVRDVVYHKDKKIMKARVGKVKLCVPNLWDGTARFFLGFVKIVSWNGDADTIELICEWNLFDEVDIAGEIPLYHINWTRTENSVSMNPVRA